MNATQPRTAPTVEALDLHAGDQHAYLIDGIVYWVRVTAGGLEFEREDTRARHDVRVVRGVATACGCPDAKWHRRCCKHALAAPAIWRELW